MIKLLSTNRLVEQNRQIRQSWNTTDLLVILQRKYLKEASYQIVFSYLYIIIGLLSEVWYNRAMKHFDTIVIGGGTCWYTVAPIFPVLLDKPLIGKWKLGKKSAGLLKNITMSQLKQNSRWATTDHRNGRFLYDVFSIWLTMISSAFTENGVETLNSEDTPFCLLLQRQISGYYLETRKKIAQMGD